MNTTKPGWQTTEFWMKILSVDVPALIAALSGHISIEHALEATVISQALFNIGRVVQKSVVDFNNAKQGTPTIPPV